MTNEKWLRPMLLALDASTTAVGWAIMTGNGVDVGFEVVRLGTYVPKGADWVERTDSIGIWLDAMLRQWKDLIGTVAYEVATGDKRNMATNRHLGAVEYVTIFRARDWEVELVPVTASMTKAHVRQFVARRLVERAEVEERAEIGRLTQDTVDAVAVGLSVPRARALAAAKVHRG